ncbi:replication endonuclease [Halarcobacter sp.]|uniref:replication endonuclease n=1 Tax=Halarcobacter sp. TaxID=2321133 RepID=UPI0029F4FE5A|nr:replication endonuclease [Halarcobacter sp.]
MDFTIDELNFDEMLKDCEEKRQKCGTHFFSDSEHPLTIYKKVVDISENHQEIEYLSDIKYYGLSEYDFHIVNMHRQKQKEYLDKTCLYDKITEQYIPLADITMSANHNAHRYYAEIQNRINTLVNDAESKKLVPIFMTITLPSEYHKMKTNKITQKLIYNPLYNGVTPRAATKELTKMFAKLRHDRSLKELSKDERIYYRVNEPHKDGTPHTHILMFIPKSIVNRVVKAFNRLFNPKTNKIETKIRNASAYIMKYINKTLPLSKQSKLTEKEKYLNAWYSMNRVIRFNSSRTLAPLSLYRLLYHRYTLQELTMKVRNKDFSIFVRADNRDKIMEILDGDELVYSRSENFRIESIPIQDF